MMQMLDVGKLESNLNSSAAVQVLNHLWQKQAFANHWKQQQKESAILPFLYLLRYHQRSRNIAGDISVLLQLPKSIQGANSASHWRVKNACGSAFRIGKKEEEVHQGPNHKNKKEGVQNPFTNTVLLLQRMMVNKEQVFWSRSCSIIDPKVLRGLYALDVPSEKCAMDWRNVHCFSYYYALPPPPPQPPPRLTN